ncbi:fatty acyl-CoA reductase 3-like isoform X2 [Jatropha curcas]|uniref:fatty acyl-CoA reductase 3-like isoform X2 n=1 Tax=Jatropha curcas TaxID=180498 RepID=UPI001892F1F7|nr:fatty acyl-CoA reductase 3-like isoform X2 [Jatropha curcas]
MENIMQFLEHKTGLVTGVTGFLAKVFLEKLLRVQPNVKKLYLLLRAADTSSANQRFYNEVIGKDLFRVVKEKLGANLNSIIAKKIVIVAGDVSYEDLGVKDSSLREEMINDLDFILNFAATTRFDERYDVALGTNTLGAKNVLCFAKNCLKLKLLIHVSTAYVCGESSGLIMEKPYQLGEALNGVLGLNIVEEKKLIDRKLNQLHVEGSSEANIKKAMIDMGIERAKTYGWPNTYVFTKAMGEMIVGHLKENLPMVIVRPTMVTSTWREPFPGWIEGVRTIDALIVGYGSGKISFFVGDVTAIIDVIPADMVVNTIIAAMMVHANNQPCELVYHVGSSIGNPIRYSNFRDYLYFYFTSKPWILQNGKPVKVAKPTILITMVNFHRYIAIHYLPWLKVLKLANTISCDYFQGTYNNLNRKIKCVTRLVELYQPYLFFHGIFDDSNTNKLLGIAKDNGTETNNFFFDVKSIDWDDYFINTHIPSIVKYVLK